MFTVKANYITYSLAMANAWAAPRTDGFAHALNVLLMVLLFAMVVITEASCDRPAS